MYKFKTEENFRITFYCGLHDFSGADTHIKIYGLQEIKRNFSK